MKNLILEGSFAEVSAKDFTHPGLRTARVIYCDDQPNSNGFGVEYEDFPELMASLVNTPIKMKFTGNGVAGHKGSIPIGHVTQVSEDEVNGVHRIVLDTVLYADDYPDEIDWLDAQYEKGKVSPTEMPGVSFEVTYHDSILKNGVSWIKGLVARAATFVGSPAYGNRTALLALAADKSINADDFIAGLSAILKNNESQNTTEGGNNRMEKELEEALARIANLEAEIANRNTEIATKTAELETLTSTNATLTAEIESKDATIAEFETKEVLAERQAALVEAGITLELNAERIVSMSAEDFDAYVEDLKAVAEASKKDTKETKKLMASRTTRLPKFEADEDNRPSVENLASKFKSISRSNASEDTE